MDDNGMGRYMENNDDEGWDWVTISCKSRRR
jgi:hypothetical protein